MINDIFRDTNAAKKNRIDAHSRLCPGRAAGIKLPSKLPAMTMLSITAGVEVTMSPVAKSVFWGIIFHGATRL